MVFPYKVMYKHVLQTYLFSSHCTYYCLITKDNTFRCLPSMIFFIRKINAIISFLLIASGILPIYWHAALAKWWILPIAFQMHQPSQKHWMVSSNKTWCSEWWCPYASSVFYHGAARPEQLHTALSLETCSDDHYPSKTWASQSSDTKGSQVWTWVAQNSLAERNPIFPWLLRCLHQNHPEVS